MKTSVDSPIRVDFVSQNSHGLRGRLGLTIAPGKCDGVWERDLGADLHRLRRHYNTDLLVSLLEPHEYEFLRIANLQNAACDAGMEVLLLPIQDVSVPKSMGDCQAAVRQMQTWMAAGKIVVVHCRGGLGRSGLVAACCLVACGREPDAAIDDVRQARPGAIETPQQEQFVVRFAEARD